MPSVPVDLKSPDTADDGTLVVEAHGSSSITFLLCDRSLAYLL